MHGEYCLVPRVHASADGVTVTILGVQDRALFISGFTMLFFERHRWYTQLSVWLYESAKELGMNPSLMRYPAWLGGKGWRMDE